MHYTVKQLSKIARVSIRTLHYYDEIGLLKPSFIKSNGYRYYGEKELVKLQQILFFRELEFPLEKIKKIMQSTKFDSFMALSDQQKLLQLKRKRIDGLLKTIAKTINSLEGGEDMSNDDKFSAFNDPIYQEYKDEVERRWGHTETYQQARERVGKMSQEDLERIKTEEEDIKDSIAELMIKGSSVDSPEVQKQVDRFFEHLHNFYDPSYEMFKGLGHMYFDDPRFAAIYEKRAKGMAAFMRDAVVFYADEHMKQ